MASYPPGNPQNYTPNPPVGGDYKAQRRAYKQQMKMQQQQARMQARAMRRGSIVGPVLLIAVGVLFLLIHAGTLHGYTVLNWYGRWWPLLLILAGVILLAEWALDQRAEEQRVAQGLPARGARTLGGGTVWLLVLLGICGGMSRLAGQTIFDNGNGFHFNFGDFDKALGDPHDSDDALSQAIATDGSVAIDNARGDVTVTGTSDDGQMHIAVHKRVFAFSDGEAATKASQIQPTVSSDGSHLTVNVPSIEGGHADLTIQLPRNVAVTVTSNGGDDVRVSMLHAPVVITANHGNIQASGIDGNVTARMHNDDASFSAHSVTGTVTLEGRAGDINVSDVRGELQLLGGFSGTTHVERINGPLHFKTHRTDFSLARLDGEMELGTGADLRADQVMGPVVLKTTNRNITLERVEGSVNVGNTNGPVIVTSTTPLGSVNIVNRHGSVDVALPGSAAFMVDASTKNGAMENDFGLTRTGSDDRPTLNGMVGRNGPTVRIQTSDGDVTVRKGSLPPLPPLPPLPRITTAPVPPAPPAPPVKVPRIPLPRVAQPTQTPKPAAAPGAAMAWPTRSGEALG